MTGIMAQVSNYLNQKSNGSREAHLHSVAELSGVPFYTLQKIAMGQVKNPRIQTVQKILDQQKTLSA